MAECIPVDIIIPIYNGMPFLKTCLESVFNSGLVHATVILIEDSSPDPEVRRYLKRLKAEPPYSDCRFYFNAMNMGFVKSVNFGVSLSSNDVILLNADTVVTQNWVQRIQSVAYRDAAIATVTPLSNNATIASVPEFCKNNTIPETIDLNHLADFLNAEADATRLPHKLPTAVGYCMYIKREVLQRVGMFDADSFGLGYGEENDFCERAKRLGYWHALADNSFILHEGGASFHERKEQLIARHSEILAKKHPGYFPEVQAFCEANPLRPVQQKVIDYLNSKKLDSLSLEKPLASKENLSEKRPRLLFLLHNPLASQCVGGTEFHVADLIEHLKDKYHLFLASYTSSGLSLEEFYDDVTVTHTFSIPMTEKPQRNHTGKSFFEYTLPELSEIQNFLADIFQRFQFDLMHIHHLMKSSLDFITVAKSQGMKVVFTFHDFYPLCPSINLLNLEGRFCGINNPRFEGCASCLGAHLYEERDIIQRHLDLVDLVMFPSESARKISQQVYRFQQVKIVPHGVTEQFAERALEFSKSQPYTVPVFSGDRKLKIAFLGYAAEHKGVRFILNILSVLSNRSEKDRVEFHFIGETGMYTPLFEQYPELITLHGRYTRETEMELIARVSPDVVCIFSTYPETFAYTLSEALLAGIPVIVSPIGALKERVEKMKCGWVLKDFTPQAFLGAISKLLNKPVLLQRSRNIIRNLSIKQAKEMAQEHERIYEGLLQPKSKWRQLIESTEEVCGLGSK